MNDIKNPHDRFVRETFSQLEVARGVVRNYLPEDIVVVLDIDRMELLPGTFIDPDLREQITDLLYRVPLLDGSEAYLYLLLEHKSYPDRLTPFQVLGYEVRIWEDLRRNNKEPAPISGRCIKYARLFKAGNCLFNLCERHVNHKRFGSGR